MTYSPSEVDRTGQLIEGDHLAYQSVATLISAHTPPNVSEAHSMHSMLILVWLPWASMHAICMHGFAMILVPRIGLKRGLVGVL